MPPRALIIVAFLLASGSALAAQMSECEVHCENVYKGCIAGGKQSQRACMVDLEKCRKSCLRKKKKEEG